MTTFDKRMAEKRLKFCRSGHDAIKARIAIAEYRGFRDIW